MPQRASTTEELRLMSKVSSLYYIEGYKQRQIAERLRLSRPKVSRLLKGARARGIVQISVTSPENNFLELEAALEQKHGLQEAVVVETGFSESGDGAFLKRQIGAGAARYLRRTTEHGAVLGVTWGTTLWAMLQALQPISTEDVRVVQILGGVGPPAAETHAADLSRRLSQLLDGQLIPLPTPGLVGSQEAREALLADVHTQSAFRFFSQLTTAYVGIGALDTNPVFEEDSAVPEDAYDRLLADGAVGDIALRFFDEEGSRVRTVLDERLIGISFEQLGQAERVVGVAGGPQKVEAIRGALRGHFVDVLVTDHATAAKLLEDS